MQITVCKATFIAVFYTISVFSRVKDIQHIINPIPVISNPQVVIIVKRLSAQKYMEQCYLANRSLLAQ